MGFSPEAVHSAGAKAHSLLPSFGTTEVVPGYKARRKPDSFSARKPALIQTLLFQNSRIALDVDYTKAKGIAELWRRASFGGHLSK